MLAVRMGALAAIESVGHMALDRDLVETQRKRKLPAAEHGHWWQKHRSIKIVITMCVSARNADNPISTAQKWAVGSELSLTPWIRTTSLPLSTPDD